jgi:hypothetical protein
MAHQAVLNWIEPSTGDPVATYDVQKAPAPLGVIGTYVSIASVPVGTHTYTDLAVVAGDEIDYRVASKNASGESTFVTLATPVIIPLAVPAPPTGLTVVAS